MQDAGKLYAADLTTTRHLPYGLTIGWWATQKEKFHMIGGQAVPQGISRLKLHIADAIVMNLKPLAIGLT